MWWFQLKLNSAQNSFGFSCCVLGVFILSYFFVKKKSANKSANCSCDVHTPYLVFANTSFMARAETASHAGYELKLLYYYSIKRQIYSKQTSDFLN